MAAYRCFALLAIGFCVAQNVACSPVAEGIQTLTAESDPYRCMFLVHELYHLKGVELQTLYGRYKQLVIDDIAAQNDCRSTSGSEAQIAQCLESVYQTYVSKKNEIVMKVDPLLPAFAKGIVELHTCLFK